MSLTPRLLGLAFASADALIEIDAKGVVRFALGAGATVENPLSQWIGTPLSERLTADSASKLQTILQSLDNGKRSTPLEVLVDCGNDRARKATLSAFRLPELAPAISCALTYTDGQIIDRQSACAAGKTMDAQGLLAHLRSSLANESARKLQQMALAFVDVAGLDNVPQDRLEAVQDSLNATLKSASVDGNSAGQLTDSRYALLRDENDGRDLAAEVAAVGIQQGVVLSARMGEAPIGSDPAAALRAMRFAIETCLREDIDTPEASFAETLNRTLRDAERFRTLVRERNFSLFYQPIVDLKSRQVHHFEALSRFPQTSGPAAAIRMAEELALIEAFDRTVAEMAIKRLQVPGSSKLHVAVNVSGASLTNDAYITAILAMTASNPKLRSRLMIEVTETAALADLASANRRLAALRETGIKICIDDFGAGSASFDYLRGLNVDVVKIDGSLVREVLTEPRTRTMINHLVDLCRSLELETVAEMVETEEQARLLQELGVSHAQGWLFGKAEAEPRSILHSPPPIVARRRGLVETWG